MARIVVDAGHGGTAAAGSSSPLGGRGPGGTFEKDVNLALARAVKRHLGPEAVLTREDDRNLALGDRVELARRAGARALVSLHAGARPAGRRGAEVWVHPDAPPPSRGLADRVRRGLLQLGDPVAIRYGAPMAILDPRGLGDVAAVLVETDNLSDADGERRLTDPREVDRLGRAIADAVRGELPTRRYGDRARTPSAGSTAASARATVAAFRGGPGTTVWTGLSHATVATRLEQLVNDPNLVDQASISCCGPAAFLHLWFRRDPVAAVSFAAALFRTGTAPMGTRTITAGPHLLAEDYRALVPAMGTMVTPQADWMMMSGIRDSENSMMQYRGRPDEDGLQALTTPDEMREWLEATGLYRSVVQDATWAATKTAAHAAALRPAAGTDVIVMINAHMLGGSGRSGGVLGYFPNHFAVLYDPVSVSGGNVSFRIWTWGSAPATYTVSQSTFEANYYGAITATR